MELVHVKGSGSNWNIKPYLSQLVLLQWSDRVWAAYFKKNNSNLFLTVLKAWSPKSGCQLGQILVRTLFQVADCQLFTVPSHGRKRTSLLWPLLVKALIPFMRAPLSWPNYLPKAPPPNRVYKVLSNRIIMWAANVIKIFLVATLKVTKETNKTNKQINKTNKKFKYIHLKIYFM